MKIIRSARVARKTRAAMDRTLVLQALLPGGQLTIPVLGLSVAISDRRLRRAVAQLYADGSIRSARHGTAWEITTRARACANAANEQTLLDMPTMFLPRALTR